MAKTITHYSPEKDRAKEDRRKVNTFILHDRRSGIGCRRRVAQIEMEIKAARRLVTFLPAWIKR